MPVRKKKKVRIQDGQNILIIYPRRIGDCVMAIPFLMHLKAQFKVRVTVCGPAYFRDFLNGQELYDEFVDFGTCAGPVSGKEWFRHRKEIAAARKKINRIKYDIAIEPFGECFASVFMRLCRAESYAGIGIGNLYRLHSISSHYNDDRHITDNMLYLYQTLGGTIDHTLIYPCIKPMESWEKHKNGIIHANHLDLYRVIGIHCGASTAQKRWPYFHKLVRLCNERRNDVFFVLYDDGCSTDSIDKIVLYGGMKNNYLVLKTGLREYIDSLRLCDMVICNDSSCGHLCAAQGIDVIVLYGPYLPVMGTPRGNCTICLISKDMPCKPCSYFRCEYGTDYKCLKAVSPQEVFENMNKMLGT